MCIFRWDVRVILWESLLVGIWIRYVLMDVNWIKVGVDVVVEGWVFGLLIMFIGWEISSYWIIIIVIIEVIILKIDVVIVVVVVKFICWSVVFIYRGI